MHDLRPDAQERRVVSAESGRGLTGEVHDADRRIGVTQDPSLTFAPEVPARPVLDEDDGEPGELAADEHHEPLDTPRPHVHSVLSEGAEKRDGCEEGALVGGEHTPVHQEPAREAPEDPRAEPRGDDRDEDRGARAGPAEEAFRGGDGQAEEEDRAEGHEDPARHAPFRYSGPQRSSRRSTCLIPSAMTMPITPSVRSATIMSAAFSVPSEMMR